MEMFIITLDQGDYRMIQDTLGVSRCGGVRVER